MSKSNINNDDTQTEIDSIDDNNEWKVSFLKKFKNKIFLFIKYFLGG